ncbi:MAG TPA: phosphatase domain-containing protein [Ferruginibacter sp.]|nr:phosphatase domain-containing protein [Ferruginibacter sp.]
MTNESNHPIATVKVYHGYGHTHNLVVYGHVLRGKPFIRSRYSSNILTNIRHLVKIFFVNPMPGVRVRLLCGNQQVETVTSFDGFFKFEWQSATEIEAGWHPVLVQMLNNRGEISATGEGKFFVPHSTQYAFISDIDDTVLISHSATIFKRLRVMFTKNPRSRKAFADVVKHYHLLSIAHTEPSVPNPFFYVSSSEWNLYDDLKEFFRHNGLPEGVYLLNEIKKWYQLFKTGKTKHHGKLIRVARIMDAFPLQQFVLLGDNSQSDPEIYVSIAKKYPGKIYAIYIRNIDTNNQIAAEQLLNSIPDKKIHTCLFKDNEEAIQHSKAIGLVIE